MSVRRIFQRSWTLYNNALTKHPYVTQSVQTSFLIGFGDFVAQKLFNSHKPYDYHRTARFSIIGLGLGPGLHTWYLILDRVIGHGKGFKTSLMKVFADQVFCAPIMLVVFTSVLTVLEGGRLNEIQNRLKDSYYDILMANYKLWPAVQVLNFSVVPVQFRVLFVQTVALGWNTYLAWRLHYHNIKETDIKQKQ